MRKVVLAVVAEALLFLIAVKFFRTWKRRRVSTHSVNAKQVPQIMTILLLLLCCVGGCSETPPYYVTDKGEPIPVRSSITGVRWTLCQPAREEIVAAVRGILDWIYIDQGNSGYLDGTYDNSGESSMEWVWERLQGRNEIKFLIKNKDISLPVIFERFYRKEETNSQSMLVYCVVFGRTKSIEVLPYLADYIDSVPDSDRGYYSGGWHPFNFAVNAVNMITNSEVSVLPQKGEEDKNPYWFFDARHKYADAIRRWYKEHSHDSSPP